MLAFEISDALFEYPQVTMRFFVLDSIGNHSITSTSPLRTEGPFVRLKKAIQSSQSRPSSAAKRCSSARVPRISANTMASTFPLVMRSAKSAPSQTTASTSLGTSFAVTKLPFKQNRFDPAERQSRSQWLTVLPSRFLSGVPTANRARASVPVFRSARRRLLAVKHSDPERWL